MSTMIVVTSAGVKLLEIAARHFMGRRMQAWRKR
jgi:hypothetical protein